MVKTFKTKAGTELPLLNLKGKDYLQVPHRVQWFREEHPGWGIETSVVESTDKYAVVRAIISNEQGFKVATAHKREDLGHFPDYVEKAETGAIGRALALCGYGTQFAHDFDEHERIADAPLSKPVMPSHMKFIAPGIDAALHHVVPPGGKIDVLARHAGRILGDIPEADVKLMRSYLGALSVPRIPQAQALFEAVNTIMEAK